jgi:hypothetical protein
MSEIHLVEAGEYREVIAERFGFRDYHVIYDDPNNAAKHCAHYPGDKVSIPDKDPRQEPAVTYASSGLRTSLIQMG